mgnify:CR=1 FL=1
MEREVDDRNILDEKMRDKSHEEQIERWAEYVKTHKDWKIKHTQFIDAQFEIAGRFYKELAKTLEGREKIKRLRELRGKRE